MNIEKQYQDDHSVKLIVEAEQEQMNAYKRRAAAKLASRVKIPGFRPGKAPYDIVARTVGDGAITEQAIDLFLDAEYAKILDEAGINPGFTGSLESVDSVEPPKFTFRVPLAPEVDLGDYHSVRLPYEWTAPDEEKLNEALENVRQMHAAMETVERPIELGDFALVNFTSEVEALNRAGAPVFITDKERSEEWPYIGFSKELVGLKSGESVVVQHTIPEDSEMEDLRGKSVEIKAEVKIIRGMNLPDLDDALAKMTGAGETLDELKEAVKKDLEARSREEYDDQYFEDLLGKIKEGATIKYNPRTLEHESEHVMEDFTRNLAERKNDLETYLKTREITREQFMEDEVNPIAKKRLERGLIMDEIVNKENLQVDNESLRAEFDATIHSLAMQGVDFSKMGGGKKRQKELSQSIAASAANRVITRKALETMKAIAIGEYKPVEQVAVAQENVEAQPEATQETEASPQENVEA